MKEGALWGRRILVTRAAPDGAQWAERLTALGAAPVLLPCLERQTIGDATTAGRLRRALEDASWLVLASPRAVDAVVELLGPFPPPSFRLAVVGPATAEAAATWRAVDLVAAEPTGAGLARDLVTRLQQEGTESVRGAGMGTVVIAGSAEGRRDVEDILTAEGLTVIRIPVYHTVPAPAVEPRRDLAAEAVDTVLLASPSAVTGLLNQARVPAGTRVITIGPTTTAAARAAGLWVTAEATAPNLEGMLEAMS